MKLTKKRRKNHAYAHDFPKLRKIKKIKPKKIQKQN